MSGKGCTCDLVPSLVALILYLNLNLVLCERQVRLAELVTWPPQTSQLPFYLYKSNCCFHNLSGSSRIILPFLEVHCANASQVFVLWLHHTAEAVWYCVSSHCILRLTQCDLWLYCNFATSVKMLYRIRKLQTILVMVDVRHGTGYVTNQKKQETQLKLRFLQNNLVQVKN